MQIYYSHHEGFSFWMAKLLFSKLANGMSYWLFHHYFAAAVVAFVGLFVFLFFKFKN